MDRPNGDFGRRTRWSAFGIMAGGSTLVVLLLRLLAGFDWGVFLYGWTGAVGLALFIALFVGRPALPRRWASFGIILAVAGLAAAFLVRAEGLPAPGVLIYGLLPFALILLAATVFVRRRVAPYRVVQIICAVLLNAYIVAYLQNRILYQGIFKYVPQPILNCYGGPLAVFACPIGSTQQMVGMKLMPWLPLGLFIIIGAFVGRAACAWVCPFGLWQDLLRKVPFGPRAGGKRWIAFGTIAGLGIVISLLLVLLVPLPAWPVFVFGWLPFTGLVLVVALRGRFCQRTGGVPFDIPRRMWLGGWLAAVGLGALVWFRFGIGYGVATGFVAMFVLGLSGRWVAAALTAVAGGLVAASGGFAVGPLSGVGLGLGLGAAGLGLVLLLDNVLKVSLPATWLKYGVLLLVAMLASYLTIEPWFCKLCPQGTLGAGIPLVLWDPVSALRSLVGWLYWVKIGILLSVVVAAIAIKRPFCRLVCPIGAVYAPFNKGSLMKMELDQDQCTDCGVCRRVCPMDIEPNEGTNQLECIRCFECVWACPRNGFRVKV